MIPGIYNIINSQNSLSVTFNGQGKPLSVTGQGSQWQITGDPSAAQVIALASDPNLVAAPFSKFVAALDVQYAWWIGPDGILNQDKTMAWDIDGNNAVVLNGVAPGIASQSWKFVAVD